MRRGHRRVHRLLWPILAVAVALGLTLALALRPPPKAEGQASAVEASRP